MAFKVYTKTGDKGTTGLIGGARVPKDHIRIEAYGTVDELNSQLGLLRSSGVPAQVLTQIEEIQDRLFTVGSVLATDPEKTVKILLPDLHETDIEQLEGWIDQMEVGLPPLKAFVLPGGSLQSATAHVARCVCRRAERICVHMQHSGHPAPEVVLRYLNRLSDYLFVLSRHLLMLEGGHDIEWHPRATK